MPDREVVWTCKKPPSTNNLFHNTKRVRGADGKVRGGGRAKTKTYKEWIERAGWEIKEQGPLPLPRFAGDVTLILEMPPGIDIDNIKAIPDLLQSLGVIDNDENMTEMHVYRRNARYNCLIKLIETSKRSTRFDHLFEETGNGKRFTP